VKARKGEYAELFKFMRKEGFVRRAVLLVNNRTREAWMYRYSGFIPRAMVEFKIKYTERRQVSGYNGTGPADDHFKNPNDRFLSEEQIMAAVARCAKPIR